MKDASLILKSMDMEPLDFYYQLEILSELDF